MTPLEKRQKKLSDIQTKVNTILDFKDHHSVTRQLTSLLWKSGKDVCTALRDKDYEIEELERKFREENADAFILREMMLDRYGDTVITFLEKNGKIPQDRFGAKGVFVETNIEMQPYQSDSFKVKFRLDEGTTIVSVNIGEIIEFHQKLAKQKKKLEDKANEQE